jgi:hypothetical protein
MTTVDRLDTDDSNELTLQRSLSRRQLLQVAAAGTATVAAAGACVALLDASPRSVTSSR